MKKYRYLILGLSVLLIIGLCILLGKPVLEFMVDPDKITAQLQSLGILGPIVFMLLNIVQVLLAIIPGGPFEVAAGALWGPVWGTIMCDIAMSTGGVVTFLFVKKFGIKFVELFTTRENIESVKFLKANKKSTTLLFLFFLLPGTPKDLICYVVGLSNIKLSTWIWINLIGRFPAILLSALGGSALGDKKYGIVIAAIAIIVVLYFIGSFVYSKFNKDDESAVSEDMNKKASSDSSDC